MGYTVIRGGAKIVMLCMLLFAVASCCGDAYVRRDSIDGLVNKVTERHDRFIKGEATDKDKDPAKKDSHLRSAELLRMSVADPDE